MSNVLLEAYGMALDSVLAKIGLSDAQIGDRLGVSGETVRLWRHGKRRMSPTHVRAVEKKFNIPKHVLRPDIYDAPSSEKAA